MPDFTEFLNLYLPGGGSTGTITPDEVADIDRLNQNFRLIDDFAEGWGSTSSSNRSFYGPAAERGNIVGMKRGDTYQESDGEYPKFYVYDGSNWKNRTRARAQLVSGTAAINGNASLNWSTDVSGLVYQEGGKFWENTPGGNPIEILFPYAGRYRINYTVRTTGVAPISVSVFKNGTNLGTDVSASAFGTSGAASHTSRLFDVELLSTDKLQIAVTSTTTASARSMVTIEYLGEI